MPKRKSKGDARVSDGAAQVVKRPDPRPPPPTLEQQPRKEDYACTDLAFNGRLVAIPIDPCLKGKPRVVRVQEYNSKHGELVATSRPVPTSVALQSGEKGISESTPSGLLGLVVGVAPAYYNFLAMHEDAGRNRWNPYVDHFQPPSAKPIDYNKPPQQFTVLRENPDVPLVVARQWKKNTLGFSVLLHPDEHNIHKAYLIPFTQVFLLPQFRDYTLPKVKSALKSGKMVRQMLESLGLYSDKTKVDLDPSGLPHQTTENHGAKRLRIEAASRSELPDIGVDSAHPSQSGDAANDANTADNTLAGDNEHVIDNAVDGLVTNSDRSTPIQRPQLNSHLEILIALNMHIQFVIASRDWNRLAACRTLTVAPLLDDCPDGLSTPTLWKVFHYRLLCEQRIDMEVARRMVEEWKSLVGGDSHDHVTPEEMMKVNEAVVTNRITIDPEKTQRFVASFVDRLRMWRTVEQDQSFWWSASKQKSVLEHLVTSL